MKFFKPDHISFPFILLKVGELINASDPQKVRSHVIYLLEEISYARYQWEISIENKDWGHAAKILHREKLIIHQLDLIKDESILLKILKNEILDQSLDLKLFYTELIQLFSQLEKMIGSSI